MDSIAAETLRYRKFLDADVKIFADVHIKHGYPLSQRPIAQSAYDTEHRGLADAILVTGIATGAETKLDDVKEVKDAVEYTPVFVASGVDDKNVGSYSKCADGIIIGTHIKENNDTEEPIDPVKLKHFMDIARKTWAK
jgi:membrane complex biogenesis BtpA family protein